jgi:hypothetical protein
LQQDPDDVERSAGWSGGGWIVTSSVNGDDGVKWVSLTFFPEPEPDLDDEPSGSWPRDPWPRDPSVSSKTARLRRRSSS